MTGRVPDWEVRESWEGDGKPGASFLVGGTDISVFVSEFDDTRREVSQAELELAVRIRDFLRGTS